MPPTRFRNTYGINASGQNVPVNNDTCVLMDAGITIGQIPVPLNNSYVLTNAALTENNPGDVSINVGAGVNAVIGLCCSEYLKQVNAFLSTTTVPAIGADGKLVDGTGDTPVAKGTMVTSVAVAYSVQGGPLTSFNFRLDRNTQGNGVGNGIVALVANGQNGLSLANTAAATTCSVITIPVANPVFETGVSSQMYIRLNPVTPGGCTFRLYSVSLNVTFNYN